MTFGTALEHIKSGGFARRRGWNGKGMFVGLRGPEGILTKPHLVMKTADDEYVPWLASQTDILADDWEPLFEDQVS